MRLIDVLPYLAVAFTSKHFLNIPLYWLCAKGQRGTTVVFDWGVRVWKKELCKSHMYVYGLFFGNKGFSNTKHVDVSNTSLLAYHLALNYLLKFVSILPTPSPVPPNQVKMNEHLLPSLSTHSIRSVHKLLVQSEKKNKAFLVRLHSLTGKHLDVCSCIYAINSGDRISITI